jgi:hypothetical protein
MSFDIAWLDLREPADRAARDHALLQRAQAHLACVEMPVVVDLGAGSGGTVRAFGGWPPARWQLVDNDAVLLAEAKRRCGPEVATLLVDLRDLDALPLSGARLVTASALLDLTSAAWVEALAGRIVALNAGFYATLIYDGCMAWTPVHPDDATVTAAFNRHQRRDKGFGPALGPLAGVCLEAAMHSKGYRVWTAASPWRLDFTHAALQRELLAGIANAASEAGASIAEAWRQRRADVLPAGSCVVGHVDVLALPAG